MLGKTIRSVVIIAVAHGFAIQRFHFAKQSLQKRHLCHANNVFPASATVKSAYDHIVSILQSQNVPEPENSARYIICAAENLGYRQSEFMNSWNREIKSPQVIESHLQRRLNREPVQYIIGDWDFNGLTLDCKPPVLIPRPETENLIEYIIQNNQLKRMESPRILDIGTGTGAIGLALLCELKEARVRGIDINPIAVELSNQNANKNKLSDRYHCEEFCAIRYLEEKRTVSEGEKFDVIVSNPPYIPSNEMTTLEPEVRNYEDVRALHGGPTGLDLISNIIERAFPLLSSRGLREVWLEVSHNHPDIIYDKYHGKEVHNCEDNCVYKLHVTKFTDIFGQPRFVKIFYEVQ